MKEKAVLVTLDFKEGHDPEDASQELAELSGAAGLMVCQNLIYRQREPNATFLMGRGKAEEIQAIVEKEKAQVVVVDSDLSSTQQRNLEEIVQVKTIDRTQLILDIFALRARSTEGKLQVELAQLKYLLPRLAGEGIYLSRLGGGVGTRGPGEQKLEMDRRRIREKISKLSHQLKDMDSRRIRAIKKKKDKELPLVALVGYTNAGKSTLFNRLASASVLVKDQLFSTLDTTTRILDLPGNQKAFLVDTVGFVKRLPHHLVESFKATLEETIHADILIHVTDASRPDLEDVKKAVDEVLGGLGALENKTLYVLNKSDLLDEATQKSLSHRGYFLASAHTGEGVELLKQAILENLPNARTAKNYFIPRRLFNVLHWLYEEGQITAREDKAEGVYVCAVLTDKDHNRLEKKLKDS